MKRSRKQWWEEFSLQYCISNMLISYIWRFSCPVLSLVESLLQSSPSKGFNRQKGKQEAANLIEWESLGIRVLKSILPHSPFSSPYMVKDQRPGGWEKLASVFDAMHAFIFIVLKSYPIVRFFIAMMMHIFVAMYAMSSGQVALLGQVKSPRVTMLSDCLSSTRCI